MIGMLQRSVSPRNGHTLVVGIVARISGCQNQKELSLEDQVDHAKQVVAELYQGPVEYHEIATQAKGERLDRPELADVEALLRSRELDLLMVEDIGRMVRGAAAVPLCGIAVDHGTRVLAPNDCIDTAEDTWEEDVISACRDHVGHNSHTSKRIKHKKMNRFLKFGGATACQIYGYIKPPGAKTYADWQLDPEATPVYQEWFRRLRETRNCAAVADWLNEQGVSPGPYCRRQTWDGKMVRRVTANTLLKGMPGRGFKHTVKHHESGRRISVKNPKGPQFREYPALAHVTPAVWDEVNELIATSNAGYGRKPLEGRDPRLGVPRKRTRFPGQHALCAYCGRQYVWGGNGIVGNLMCSGAREWKCWNSVGFNGQLAAKKVVETVTAAMYHLDSIDEQFRGLVMQESRQRGADLTQRWDQLGRAEDKLAQEKKNLVAAISEYGPRPMFQEQLAKLEASEREHIKERRDLERLATAPLDLPASVVCLRQQLEEHFEKLTWESAEFGPLMSQLVPEFHVYLVRLCDTGHLLPRARIKVDFAACLPDAKHIPDLEQLLALERTIDLFVPPQRERIREAVVHLTDQGLNQREIVRQLPEKATQTAVQHALALHRKIQALSLDTPFIPLQQPPSDYTKLRRHLNRKYHFTPLEGFPQQFR